MLFKNNVLEKTTQFTLFLLLMAPLYCLAQGGVNLFAVIDPESAGLNVTQQTRWNRLSPEQYDVKKIISVNNLPALINSEGMLEIDLPDDSCSMVRFRADDGRSEANGDYYFYGSLVPGTTCNCEDGYFMLQKKDGAVFGEIVVDENIFQVVSLTGGLSAYLRIDPDYSDGRGCGIGDEPDSLSIQPVKQLSPPAQPDFSGLCNEVRVLFFYTPAAEDQSDPFETAIQCISQVNQALRNSKVPETSLQFVFAGVVPLALSETSNPSNDLTAFRTTPIVATLRSSYFADVAVLFTDGDYENQTGVSPPSNIGMPMSGLAFTLLEIQEAIGDKVFAHEIAHVLGCDHQLCSLTQGTGCSKTNSAINHGFNFKYGGWPKKFRLTLMQTLGEGKFKAKRRILHYSSPDVIYHGVATGNSTADNAGWLSGSAACTVSNYLPNPPDAFSAFIFRDDTWNLAPGQTIDLQPVLIGGTAPFTYAWSVSFFNPFAFGSPFATSATTTFQIPNPCADCIFFIRLEVTSSDGRKSSNTVKFNLGPEFSSGCGNVYSPQFIQDRASENEPENTTFSVFPNPAANRLEVQFNNSQGSTVLHSEIMNAEGKVYAIQYFQVGNTGLFKGSIDLSSVPNGIYMVRLRTSDRVFVSPINVIKP